MFQAIKKQISKTLSFMFQLQKDLAPLKELRMHFLDLFSLLNAELPLS